MQRSARGGTGVGALMSYRPHLHHHHGDYHGRRQHVHRDGHQDDRQSDHHDTVLRRGHQTMAPVGVARRIAASDYTLGHGRYQVRLGPVAFWTVVGTLVIMASWSIVTATYFAFHDDVLTRLIARQAEMQFAYEDRIADLRAQVDRVMSRQLLDLEQKLDQVLRRQSTLEQRATTLGTLPDLSITGSVRPPAARPSLGK